MTNPGNKVYLKRVFNAPVEKVFEALTNPKSITQWFGPKNSRTISAIVSLEVGGSYQFEVKTKNETTFFVEGKYIEISRPYRLVYTAEYRDLPGSPEMKSTITLELSQVLEGTELAFVQELEWIPDDIQSRSASWELMFDRMRDSLISHN